MKTSIALVLLFVSSSNLFAQTPDIVWQKNQGGTSWDEAKMILPIQNGYIVAGNSSSSNGDVTGNNMPSYYGDIWVTKLDNLRNIIWQKCLGGNSYDNIGNISQTIDGGFIIVGNTQSGELPGFHFTLNGNTDILVVKLNSSGDVEWQKCLGGSLSDNGFDILQTIDGGYIIAGSTDSFDGDLDGFFSSGNGSCWIVKLNNSGIIDWQKRIGGNGSDVAKCIKQLPNGGYIFTGFTTSTNDAYATNQGNYDVLVVRTDTTGNIIWQKCYGGTNNETSENIQLTNDGGFIIAGTSNSNDGNVTNNNGDSDFWIVKLDTIGGLEWQKSIGTAGKDTATYVQQTSDNNYVVSGIINEFQDEFINIGDAYLIKLNSSGNEMWSKTLGGSMKDKANSVTQTIDGGYLVSGYSYSNDGDLTGNNGFSDFWILKLSADTLSTTSVLENSNFLMYPNPTRSTVTVNDEIVALKIYTIDGKRIELQYSNNIINVSNLANGTYILIGENKNGKLFENKLIKK